MLYLENLYKKISPTERNCTVQRDLDFYFRIDFTLKMKVDATRTENLFYHQKVQLNKSG